LKKPKLVWPFTSKNVYQMCEYESRLSSAVEWCEINDLHGMSIVRDTEHTLIASEYFAVRYAIMIFNAAKTVEWPNYIHQGVSRDRILYTEFLLMCLKRNSVKCKIHNILFLAISSTLKRFYLTDSSITTQCVLR